MNKYELIKKIHYSYIAEEGVLFIKTDDFPRALSAIELSLEDKSLLLYNPSRGYHRRSNWNEDDDPHDSFQQLVASAGDVQEDLLLLHNCHEKFTDNVVDVLSNFVTYGDNSTFIIFVVPFDYSLPRELDNVNCYELLFPCSKEIEEELFSIFKNKTRLFNKLDLPSLVNALLGLPLYKIQRFFKYELFENEDRIKSRGEQYLIEQLEEERFAHIDTINALFVLKSNDVVIAGCEHVKSKIYDVKDLISVHNRGYKISRPKGLLLHGSPGVGKTEFAKYIANELNHTLLKVDLGGVYNKWLGVPEERLNIIINFIDSIGNCTVLIDEIHLLFDTEAKAEDTTNRLLNSLLTYMSENDNNVFFVFTANDISKLPPALLRKGRLDHVIEIPLPDYDERKAIADLYLKINNFQINNLDNFAGETKEKSGADIKWIVEKAIVKSVKEEKDLTEEMLIAMVDT